MTKWHPKWLNNYLFSIILTLHWVSKTCFYFWLLMIRQTYSRSSCLHFTLNFTTFWQIWYFSELQKQSLSSAPLLLEVMHMIHIELRSDKYSGSVVGLGKCTGHCRQDSLLETLRRVLSFPKLHLMDYVTAQSDLGIFNGFSQSWLLFAFYSSHEWKNEKPVSDSNSHCNRTVEWLKSIFLTFWASWDHLSWLTAMVLTID